MEASALPAAVLLPCRANFRGAVEEARATPHHAAARLYTDGNRVAWLPQPMPGWFRVGAAVHEELPCAA